MWLDTGTRYSLAVNKNSLAVIAKLLRIFLNSFRNLVLQKEAAG